jgi:cellobiose phosphorylase
VTVDDVVLFNRLAASVVFTNAQLRPADAVAANRLGQPGLWPHGISGDLPIVLVQVKAAEDELLVRQLIQWRTYTRRRGMELDLVVLDQRAGEPSEQLRAALQSGIDSEILGKSGGVFVLSAEQIAADHVVLLMAAARAVLGGGRGPWPLTRPLFRRDALSRDRLRARLQLRPLRSLPSRRKV